jgi:hypothetical protein
MLNEGPLDRYAMVGESMELRFSSKQVVVFDNCSPFWSIPALSPEVMVNQDFIAFQILVFERISYPEIFMG